MQSTLSSPTRGTGRTLRYYKKMYARMKKNYVRMMLCNSYLTSSMPNPGCTKDAGSNVSKLEPAKINKFRLIIIQE